MTPCSLASFCRSRRGIPSRSDAVSAMMADCEAARAETWADQAGRIPMRDENSEGAPRERERGLEALSSFANLAICRRLMMF